MIGQSSSLVMGWLLTIAAMVELVAVDLLVDSGAVHPERFRAISGRAKNESVSRNG